MTELKKILKKIIKENEKTIEAGYFEKLNPEARKIYLAGMHKGIINTCKSTLIQIKKQETTTKASKKQGKNKTQTKKFTKPTIEAVALYCLERKNNVNPEMFHNHYEARDWVLNNRQKMKDWQAAVRTWEGRDFTSTSAKKTREEPTPEWLKKPTGPIIVEKPEDAAGAVDRIKKMKESYQLAPKNTK